MLWLECGRWVAQLDMEQKHVSISAMTEDSGYCDVPCSGVVAQLDHFEAQNNFLQNKPSRILS